MWKIVMGAALAALALLAGAASPGTAQAGAWCQTDQDLLIVNCGYVSFEQCRATISGVGGLCLPNQMPEPAPAPRPRKKH